MKKLFILILIVSFKSIVAQDFKTEVIADKVDYLMLFDSKERLWYSDGEKIFMYNGQINEQNIFSLNRENNLFEENGKLWGVTKDGFICYEDEKWKEYKYQDEAFVGTSISLFFTDSKGRTYFINKGERPTSKPVVAIFEGGKFSYLTQNLPAKINEILEYKDGVLFGYSGISGKYKYPCGYYDGHYTYFDKGFEFTFFNSIQKRTLFKGTYLADVDVFKKYNILNVSTYKDGLIILTNEFFVSYNIHNKNIEEFKINPEYSDLLQNEPYLNNIFRLGETAFVTIFDKGLLEVTREKSTLHNKKNGFSDDEINRAFIDDNNNLVLMHPKTASALINGKWKVFDEETGYDLNKLMAYHKFQYKNETYVTGINIKGKSNRLLRWNGENWKTFELISSKYTNQRTPFIFQDKVWFYYHNGNTYKGFKYFDGNTYIEFPLGEKVKDNWITSVYHSNEILYVLSANMGGKGKLFKVMEK